MDGPDGVVDVVHEPVVEAAACDGLGDPLAGRRPPSPEVPVRLGVGTALEEPHPVDLPPAQTTGSKRAVKWRSVGGCSTIRIPRRSLDRSATQRTTSMT